MQTKSKFNRVAVTGGAGYLGTMTCRHLCSAGHLVRAIDLHKRAESAGMEWEEVAADVGDFHAMERALKDIDLVIHLGASLAEDDWSAIHSANVVGAYNIFETARRNGIQRIVYASSHHVSGMYPVTEMLNTKAPTRPDSLYGLSKVFAEQTAQYYWDKYGLESVGLRIGSVRPGPQQVREHFTWLSEEDYRRLLDACLSAPVVEHTLVWGVSDNDGRWWDNSGASHLGFVPRDRAAAFGGSLTQADARSLKFQGGKRALFGLKEES